MNQPFYNLVDIPNPDKDKEFWNTLENQNFKHAINFLILNELRRFDPTIMDDNQCRTQIAKLRGWQELLDLPEAIKNQGVEKMPTEQLP